MKSLMINKSHLSFLKEERSKIVVFGVVYKLVLWNVRRQIANFSKAVLKVIAKATAFF